MSRSKKNVAPGATLLLPSRHDMYTHTCWRQNFSSPKLGPFLRVNPVDVYVRVVDLVRSA